MYVFSGRKDDVVIGRVSIIMWMKIQTIVITIRREGRDRKG